MSFRLPIRANLPVTRAVAALVFAPTLVYAQSSSRSQIRSAPIHQSAPIRRSAPVRPSSPIQQGSNSWPATAGSDSGQVAASPTALSGYCPVCVVDMKQWVRGNPSFQATFNGRTYYFPGDEQRQKSLANPQKYMPVLGRECAVCLTDMNKRMQGSVLHAALSGGRLFLFPNAEIKEKFRADLGKYLNTDLAMGGQCAVCRVVMDKAVQGKPELSLIHGGLRYQFPGEDQLRMFISNPTKYTKAADGVSGGNVVRVSDNK